MKTGTWVRKAAQAKGVIIMERGEPVAKMVPFSREDGGAHFADRPLVEGFEKLPRIRHDSGKYISEARDRA